MTTNVSNAKRIHFVRHAESFCNCLRRELKVHLLPQDQRPVITDAGLTQQGVEQTKHLKVYLQTLQIEIAISSPYTSALQTCLLSYGSDNVVISSLCAEKMDGMCDDIGLPASCLKVAFPMFDFSSLDEIWWYLQDGIKSQSEAVQFLTHGKLTGETEDHLADRAEKFLNFLREIPKQNIVVFSHCDFLAFFLSKYFEFNEYSLDNCQVFSVNLEDRIL